MIGFTFLAWCISESYIKTIALVCSQEKPATNTSQFLKKQLRTLESKFSCKRKLVFSVFRHLQCLLMW